MLILGINAYHGDASACAIVDGQLVAAAEEERFSRVKHMAGFPTQALRYVMRASGTNPGDVKILAVARDPWARILRKALYAVRMPVLAKRRVTAQSRFGAIAEEAARALGVPASQIEIQRVEHHRAHLASAFFVSPFDEAALFSLDGLGDFASAMWGVGRGNRIEPLGAVAFPHSLGLYYTAVTQYLGFCKYGDEYKAMGLAAYGQPDFIDEFRRMVIAKNGGRMRFELNPEYFTHQSGGASMTFDEGEPILGRLYSERMAERLGPARGSDEPLTDRHQAIASSMQRRLEEVVLDRLRSLQKATGMRRLCLAGGVAFNCAANGKIFQNTGFDEAYVQSAAGDAGLAIGAAMHVWHQELGKSRDFIMEHAYWGSEFHDAYIKETLDSNAGRIAREGCTVRRVNDEAEFDRIAAGAIADGQVIGWFQGRMEWGPRSLGNRSILADPRRKEMRDILNAKIKRREMFRPFAPSILEEAAGDYFTESHPSPFMLMAYPVRPEKRVQIPATTHVDGTGRLQTVNQRQNRRYYNLIKEFGRQTGTPVLLNTSFNENEPVVRRPEEALDCFLRTRMDLLAIGSYLVARDANRLETHLRP